MSSESFDRTDADLFLWKERLEAEKYIRARYTIETSVDLEGAAIAMAKEQSATTSYIKGSINRRELDGFSARVVSVRPCGKSTGDILPGYSLNTAVYRMDRSHSGEYECGEIEIAYPIANFDYSVINMLNAVGAEVHRLGFFNAVRIEDIIFPEPYLDHFEGPLHGIKGLRERLGFDDRPVLCRSTRPAVGLTTEKMVKINEQVLVGGFDVIKDDELTCDTPVSPFKERVRAMVDLTKRTEDRTGEKKCYIANVIDDPEKTLALADYAAEAGASGVLVAPVLQGFSIAEEIAKRTGLMILAHPSWEDVWCRHPRFGVRRSLFFKLQRLCGADMVILPGDFATEDMNISEGEECLRACRDTFGSTNPMMPVIAGGKRPEEYNRFLNIIQSPDFMIIAATAVDEHPVDIAEGAKAFRNAWYEIKPDC